MGVHWAPTSTFPHYVCQKPNCNFDRDTTVPTAGPRAQEPSADFSACGCGARGPGPTNTVTAQILTVGRTTVERARRAFTRQGLAAALQPHALGHPRRTPPLGRSRAELTQLARRRRREVRGEHRNCWSIGWWHCRCWKASAERRCASRQTRFPPDPEGPSGRTLSAGVPNFLVLRQPQHAQTRRPVRAL